MKRSKTALALLLLLAMVLSLPGFSTFALAAGEGTDGSVENLDSLDVGMASMDSADASTSDLAGVPEVNGNEETEPMVVAQVTEDPVVSAPAEADDINIPEVADNYEASNIPATSEIVDVMENTGIPETTDTIEDNRVSVLFTTTPEDAELVVYTKDVFDVKTPIEAESDGTYLLLPGVYFYTITAENYTPVEETELRIEASEEPVLISVTMSASNMVMDEEQTAGIEETPAAEDLETEEAALTENEVVEEKGEEGKVSYLPGLAPTASEMSSATVISVGKTYTATISNPGSYAYFRFSPAAAGTYFFSSDSAMDTYGYLYDANGEELDHNDDGGGNSNFLISYALEAGKTYYYGARFYSSSDTGSFNVALTKIEEGWQKIGSEWYYYYSDGSYATGLQTIGGKQYYFYEYNGAMASNTRVVVDEKSYFFTDSGAMQKGGWAKSSEYGYTQWYYAGSDGVLLKGWQKINGTWYYFDPDSEYMYVGANKIDGKMYYFSESGAWVNKAGWQSIPYPFGSGKAWFYNDETGTPVTGWKKINGTWYYFDEEYGIMSTGVRYITDNNGTGNWWYFSASGAWVNKPGWQSFSYTAYTDSYGATAKEWVYINSDGTLVTGWQDIKGSRYYFEDAIMFNGVTREIDGSTYYFEPSGALTKTAGWHRRDFSDGGHNYWYTEKNDGIISMGWKNIGGKTYYFGSDDGQYYHDGVMYHNAPYYIDGALYFFTESGSLASGGWQSVSYTINNVTSKDWYYTNSDGTVVTGWVTVGGVHYYFDPDYRGLMHKGGWYEVEGKMEFFDQSGACKTDQGWIEVDGNMRYRKSDGKYATGWYKVENIYYFFDSNGNVKTGWVKSGSKWYYCSPEMNTNTVVYDNGKYFYVDASGAMRASKGWVSFKFVNSVGYTEQYWFYVKDSSGAFVDHDWVQDNGKWYYMMPDMVKNMWVVDNGYRYYFDSNGVWTGEKEEVYYSSSGYAVAEEGDAETYAVTSAFAADIDTVWQGVA